MSNVCYVRISKEQGADPTSIENQIRYCREQTHELFNAKLDMVFEEEGKTGADLDRPELQRLFQLAETGAISTVFVNTVDRLSRDMTDALIARRRFLRAGVFVYAVQDKLEVTSDDDFDQFRVALGGWQGQVERRKITANLQGGRLEKIRRGEWGCGGAAPFGYMIKRHDLEDGSRQVFLEINDEEASLVQRIFDMYLVKHMPVTEITYTLNREGIPSPYQRRRNRLSRGWYDSTVAKMLKSTTYIGEHRYQLKKSGETFIVSVPSIVSVEQHRQAVERMASRHLQRRRKNNYLLQALVWCAWCGRRYIGATGTNDWRGYKCSGRAQWKLYQLKEPCQNTIHQGRRLEQAVWDDITDFIQTGGAVVETIAQQHDINEVQYQAELAILESALDSKDEAEAWLLLARSQGQYTDRALTIAMKRLNRERDELHRQIAGLESAQDGIQVLHALSARLDELKAQLTAGDVPFETQQAIVHELVGRVEVDGDDVNMNYVGLTPFVIQNKPAIQRTLALNNSR